MADEIRFTHKKVDESWKDQVVKEKLSVPASGETPSKKVPAVTSKPFLNLLSSLGYQAMFNLGEMPGESGEGQVDLAAAREIIDLLAALQSKTSGNLSPEEKQVFDTLLPELQMKFSSRA